jgi:diguanylate cyclase (GGDEF)-like protein/PAS domain S-box-containing protein
MRKTIEINIESELNNTTKTILDMVKTTADASIKNYLRAIAEKNMDIVSYYYQQSKTGVLTEEEAKERAGKILLSQTIGKTGYIFVWDIKNAPKSIILAVHPKIRGENVAYVDFVQTGATMKNGYIDYKWKNPGEKEARDKAMYLAYFEPWQWVIAASSYREEFANLVNIDYFRNSILSIRFGRTGYPYILDSSGNIIVHPTVSGNAYDVKDSTGRKFVKEICAQKNGKITYTWRNSGAEAFREKLAVFNYIPEFDWIVASSRDLGEIYAPLNLMRNIIFAIFFTALVFLFLLSFWYASYIMNNLNRLIRCFQKGSTGDLRVRVSQISEDEFGRLSQYFNDFMEKLDIYNQALQREIKERKEAEESLKKEKNTLFFILENHPSGVSVIGRDGVYRYVNPEFTIITGYTLSDVSTGRDWFQKAYPDPEYRKKVLKTWKKDSREEGKGADVEFTIMCKDGSEKDIEFRMTYLKDFSITVMNDITARKQAEYLLKKSEERYRTLFEGSKDAIYITTKEGRFIDFNQAYLELFGYTNEEMAVLKAKNTYANPDDRFTFKKTIEEKGSVRDYEVKLRRKDGLQMDCIIAAIPRYADDMSISGYQGIIRDITEKKQMEERFRTLSIVDDLTGLYNRRGFFTLAQQQMKVTERTKKNMLLFFIDLDKMKQINDTLGHKEGDKALIEVATILKEVFRESDIIGRMGGDEFAILAIDTNDETREVLINRLHNILDDYNKTEGRKYQPSLSIGIAHYDPEKPSSLDELMAQADTLMYEEKRNKRH